MINEQEIWEIDVQGQIYEANFDELLQWITEGSVLPRDKVRRGNLRWIEAEKVPLLYGFFNAQEFDIDVQPFVSAANQETPAENEEIFANIQNFFQNEIKPQNTKAEPDFAEKTQPTENIILQKSIESVPDSCAIHPESKPRYVCKTCLTLYCKTCPKSYGSEVKICPLCGALCNIYEGDIDKLKSVGAINKPYVRIEEERFSAIEDFSQNRFTFSDLGAALVYPFKFKASLIFGTILFVLFSLGQLVWTFGSVMLISAIFCAMLANTLTFGILSNTVENFSQGKTTADFMPRFDDFSAWDDVIQPFLLSIGVYLVSFGLMIVLLIGATWNTISSLNEIDEGKDKIISSVLPVPPNDSALANQSAQVNEIVEKNKKPDGVSNESAAENAIADMQNTALSKQTELQKLKNQIKQSQEAKILAINKDSLDKSNDLSQMPGNVMRLSLSFSIPIFLAFLWGIFYFPAACAVAAYTRSFAATLNPLIGFDTIKRLGFDYVKILGILLILGSFAVVFNTILGNLFAPLDLPQIGNLAVKTVDGILYFYISIVFSVVLGFVIYKNSKNLNLFR